MNTEMLDIVKSRKGFIAALDQSGGSSSKTLALYGIGEDQYSSEEEMFDLIHEMRKRVITSDVFDSKHIVGTILFEKSVGFNQRPKLRFVQFNRRTISAYHVSVG